MDNDFVCKACGAPFSTKEELDAHNIQAHPEGVPEDDKEEI